MSSVVSQRNDLYATMLKAQVLTIPAKLMHEAAKEVFLGSVKMTVQDSGEAAASWNISFNSGEYITDQLNNPVVGMKGEKRSQTNMTHMVVAMMTAEFSAILPSYESLMDVQQVFVTNSVSGQHQANAQTIQAANFSKIDARIAVENKLAEIVNAFQ